MGKKKINLEEIYTEVLKNSEFGMNKTEQLKAMKEACKQVLLLAAENAKLNVNTNDWQKRWVDKDSILDTINDVDVFDNDVIKLIQSDYINMNVFSNNAFQKLATKYNMSVDDILGVINL